MLKLGQVVIIDEPPTYGRDYFDPDELKREDRVYAIRIEDNEIIYQLSCQSEDCWWVYDSLTDTDECLLDSVPTFNIGDDVVTEQALQTVKTVTTISVCRNGFQYALNNEEHFVRESSLRLYRKKDEPSEYSLF